MEKTANIVKSLSVDIESIIALNIASKDKLQMLQNENNELKLIVEQHKNKIEELKDKNKLIKIAKSLDKTGGNSAELKLKINEILREVDRCMALLNK